MYEVDWVHQPFPYSCQQHRFVVKDYHSDPCRSLVMETEVVNEDEICTSGCETHFYGFEVWWGCLCPSCSRTLHEICFLPVLRVVHWGCSMLFFTYIYCTILKLSKRLSSIVSVGKFCPELPSFCRGLRFLLSIAGSLWHWNCLHFVHFGFFCGFYFRHLAILHPLSNFDMGSAGWLLVGCKVMPL